MFPIFVPHPYPDPKIYPSYEEMYKPTIDFIDKFIIPLETLDFSNNKTYKIIDAYGKKYNFAKKIYNKEFKLYILEEGFDIGYYMFVADYEGKLYAFAHSEKDREWMTAGEVSTSKPGGYFQNVKFEKMNFDPNNFTQINKSYIQWYV